jgi:hypothetical protein
MLSLSCNDDENENCYATDVAYIISVDTPPKGKVNETINIPVDFTVYNGCGSFGKFIETKSGNTITIEVLAVYEGCICPMNVPLITENYKFYSSVAGTYYLKFKSSPTEYIIDTLNIY